MSTSVQHQRWGMMVVSAACFAAAAFPACIFLSRLRHSKRPLRLTPHGNNLPSIIHQSIRADQLKPGRLVIVGDVHGCNKELQALLLKLAYKTDEDNLFFVGDLINKGPGSVEVLDSFIDLAAWGVRGNHDDSALHRWHAWQKDRVQLKPKHDWVARLERQHVEILESLPFSISLPDFGIIILSSHRVGCHIAMPANYMQVHAGLLPGQPLQNQELWALYKMRNVCPEETPTVAAVHPVTALSPAQHTPGPDHTAGPQRRMEDGQWASAQRLTALEKVKDGGQAWAGTWSGPEHVFFGHDAMRQLQLHPHATGLDTACVYGKELSAAVLPPLSQLKRSSDASVAVAGCSGLLSAKLAAGLPIEREDLGVTIVSVPAMMVYEPPSTT